MLEWRDYYDYAIAAMAVVVFIAVVFDLLISF